jgi:hypothetical protein
MVTLNQVTPITISQLTDASTITGDEATAIVQGGQTVQAPISQYPQGMTAGVVVYGNTGGAPFPNFRTLTAGTGIQLTDGGAQSGLTISLSGASGSPAYLNTVQTFTKQQTLTPQALTSTSNSIAWDANNGNNASHAATENTTLANPTNLVTGTVYTLQWTQNASSAKALAFGSKWKFAGSSTVSTTLSAVNIITGLYDGTNINCVMTGPFS